MASMTCWGTCVPAGPSRKAAGWPLTWVCKEGNCWRTQAVSRDLLPAACVTDELMVFSGGVVSHKGGGTRVVTSGDAEGMPHWPLRVARDGVLASSWLFLTHAALAPAINSAPRFT